MIAGVTIKHLIFSLNVDTGATRSGWPVDVNAKVTLQRIDVHFVDSKPARRARTWLTASFTCPTPDFAGDCGTYHGWVVGVPINNPSTVTAWATSAIGGGIWGHGGVASGGTNMFVITGNTFNTGGHWGGGEAIIRLQARADLQRKSDRLLGAHELAATRQRRYRPWRLWPGADRLSMARRPRSWCLHWAKMARPICLTEIISAALERRLRLRRWLLRIRGQAAATYRTRQGTYFVFRASSGAISAYRITATNPPTIVPAWNVSQNGQGSPWVTTTNGD